MCILHHIVFLLNKYAPGIGNTTAVCMYVCVYVCMIVCGHVCTRASVWVGCCGCLLASCLYRDVICIHICTYVCGISMCITLSMPSMPTSIRISDLPVSCRYLYLSLSLLLSVSPFIKTQPFLQPYENL